MKGQSQEVIIGGLEYHILSSMAELGDQKRLIPVQPTQWETGKHTQKHTNTYTQQKWILHFNFG